MRSLLLACLLVATGAYAQPAERIRHVGLLANSVPLADLPNTKASQAFIDGLRENGWIVGRNIRVHWRSAEDQYERRPALIADLLAVPIDALVVSDQPAVNDATAKSKTIPIVAIGFAEHLTGKSLAKRDSNVTGFTVSTDLGILGKNLSLLKQVAPATSTVAFLAPWYVPSDLDNPRITPELTEPARALGIKIIVQRYQAIEDIEAAVDAAVQRGANAVYEDSYQPFFRAENQMRLRRAAERHRIPVLYTFPGSADNGGLVSYSVDLLQRYRRAAFMIDRILKGTKPGDIPIEMPSRYELVINLKAAKAIGLTVPASALAQADRVIQ